MANLLEDIVTFYVNNGLVTGLAIDAFVDSMPDSPDTCISIYEYISGPRPFYTDISARRIQVFNRDKLQSVAKQNSIELYNAIIPDVQRLDLTPQRWAVLESNSGPNKVRVDSKGRCYYMFDLELTTYVDYIE